MNTNQFVFNDWNSHIQNWILTFKTEFKSTDTRNNVWKLNCIVELYCNVGMKDSR